MKEHNLQSLCDELAVLLEECDMCEAAQTAALLSHRLAVPTAWATFVGETSTGKSTLINSFLGEAVLPIAAGPTSGTIVQVLCISGQEDTYAAIYDNATQRALDVPAFRALAKHPEEGLHRLMLCTGRKDEAWDGLQVFDTPGYNSLMRCHEDVLQGFLPESDVVVLTVGYRSGFGQVEGQLYAMVADSLAFAEEKPHVLLLINRIPSGVTSGDKRIGEIISRAKDCLRMDFEVLLVETSLPDDQGHRTMPETGHVWKRIHQFSLSEEVLLALRNKIRKVLLHMADTAKNTLATRHAAQCGSMEAAESVIAELSTTLEQSERLIEETFARLNTHTPTYIESEVNRARDLVCTSIDNANSWDDSEGCLAFVQAHQLPFHLEEASANLQGYVTSELEELDQRLNDLVNTCVTKLNTSARLNPQTDFGMLAANLALSLGGRLASRCALEGLKRLGGVGGSATGLGNMVKMLLSRGGKFFGKKFSREVYTAIGRLFTKRTVQGLSAAFSLVVEGVGLVWHANTWKNDLKKNVAEALENTKKDMRTALMQDMLPALKAGNLENVPRILREQIDNIAKSSVPSPQNDPDHLEKAGKRLEALQHNIMKVAL